MKQISQKGMDYINKAIKQKDRKGETELDTDNLDGLAWKAGYDSFNDLYKHYRKRGFIIVKRLE